MTICAGEYQTITFVDETGDTPAIVAGIERALSDQVAATRRLLGDALRPLTTRRMDHGDRPLREGRLRRRRRGGLPRGAGLRRGRCPVRRGLDRSALNRDTAYTPPIGDRFSRRIRE
jgi:hypothetical protein